MWRDDHRVYNKTKRSIDAMFDGSTGSKGLNPFHPLIINISILLFMTQFYIFINRTQQFYHSSLICHLIHWVVI